MKRSENWRAAANGMASVLVGVHGDLEEGPCHSPQGCGAVGVLQLDEVVATGGARGVRGGARLVGKPHREEDELLAERERDEERQRVGAPGSSAVKTM